MFTTSKRISVKNEGGQRKLLASVEHENAPSRNNSRNPAYRITETGSAGKAKKQIEELAFYSTGLLGGAPSATNSMSISSISSFQQRFMLWMEGMLIEQPQLLQAYYKDIYQYDSVSGSAVDLLSTTPFSDFTLTGLPDKVLEVYERGIKNLDMVDQMPEIAAQHLVYGLYVSSLVFDTEKRCYTDSLPYQIEDLTLEESPFRGVDPSVRISPGKSLQEFLHSDNPFFVRVRNRLSPEFVTALNSGHALLDPLTTLCLPRRVMATMGPMSYYRRILPIYFIEKTLYRGTLVEVGKRLRSILHITMGGDGDGYEPTPDELQSVAALFQQSDFDPISAVVATRGNVATNEIRHGGDFWKWTDSVEILNLLKLRALGISDAFLCLTGDTLVGTEVGPVCIDEIPAMLGLDPPTIKDEPVDINLKVRGKDGKMVRATKWYYRGRAETTLITTYAGYSVSATPQHPVLTLEKDLTLAWKKVEDLVLEDYLCLDLNLAQHENKVPLRLGLSSEVSLVLGKGLSLSTRCEYMTPELAYTLGKNTAPQVPYMVLRADVESKFAFLAAWIDKGAVLLDTVEEGVGLTIILGSMATVGMTQFQVLLAELGIASSRTSAIHITGASAFVLYRRVKRYLHRFKDVEARIEGQLAVKQDLGVPWEYVTQFIETRNASADAFISDTGETVTFPDWDRIIHALGTTGENTLQYAAYEEGKYDEFLDALEEISPVFWKRLIRLLDLQYVFEPIMEISHSKEKRPLYDLSIEDGEEPAFLANSLVVHNSREASYANSETALSIFMDQARSFRHKTEYMTFRKKIFPLLAVANGFYRINGKQPTSLPSLTSNNIFSLVADPNCKLLTPTIHWHKTLAPQADPEYMAMLQRMTDAGVPVGLRTWAAAAGFSIDKLEVEATNNAEQDLRLWQLKLELGKQKEEIARKYGYQMPDGESGQDPAPPEQASARINPNPANLLKRKWTDSEYEIPRMSRSGKVRHYIPNQEQAQEKANHVILASLESMSDPNYAEKVREKVKKAQTSGGGRPIF